MALFVICGVLADGTSTYLLLHPREGQVFIEGNPFALFLMKFIGMEGYVFLGSAAALIVIIPLLASKPTTPFHRALWWGGLLTVCLKLAAGVWNTHLYFSVY